MGVGAPSFTQLSQIGFCIDQKIGLVTSLTGKNIPHLEGGGEGGILVTTIRGWVLYERGNNSHPLDHSTPSAYVQNCFHFLIITQMAKSCIEYIKGGTVNCGRPNTIFTVFFIRAMHVERECLQKRVGKISHHCRIFTMTLYDVRVHSYVTSLTLTGVRAMSGTSLTYTDRAQDISTTNITSPQVSPLCPAYYHSQGHTSSPMYCLRKSWTRVIEMLPCDPIQMGYNPSYFLKDYPARRIDDSSLCKGMLSSVVLFL